MPAIAPAGQVVGAGRQSLPYGLFSAVTLRPQGMDRWESGVEWEPLTCGPVGGLGQPDCDPGTPTVGLPKDLDPNASDLGAASPFTVYGHFACSPVGYSPASAQELATEHLLAGEEARVEQAFWTGNLGNVPNLADSAPAGGAAMSVAEGLGFLESALATGYGGLGVIHMTRATAMQALADDLLETRAGRLFTRLGTPVVAGAGYPGTGPQGSAAPTAGQSWAYITPPLFGYRSDIFTSSARPGDLLDRANNILYAVAERSYLLGFDPCGVTAALLSLGGTP